MEVFTMGERLMIYRKRAKLTKNELAKRAGVSAKTIIKYENDEVENPDLDVLSRLASSMGITMDRILFGIESPNKKHEGLIKQ